MAIVQISQVQVRRGLNQDLPQLAGGELAWSQDTRQLYIGNGTLQEGAPVEGHTEILTQFSVLNFTNSFTGDITNLQSNVAVIQGNIVAINAEIAALQAGTTDSYGTTLGASSSGTVTNFSGNNATISYTLTQNSKQRTGTIKASFLNSVVSYDEEYTETLPTDVSFSLAAANSTHVNLNYTTTTSTSLKYKIQSI